MIVSWRKNHKLVPLLKLELTSNCVAEAESDSALTGSRSFQPVGLDLSRSESLTRQSCHFPTNRLNPGNTAFMSLALFGPISGPGNIKIFYFCSRQKLFDGNYDFTLKKNESVVV